MMDHQPVSNWLIKVYDCDFEVKMNFPCKNSWRQVSLDLPDHSEEETDCRLGISCGLSCIYDSKW